LYHFLKSCFRPQSAAASGRPGSGPSRPADNSRWFSGQRPDNNYDDPPPPYSKYSSRPNTAAAPANTAWTPGFLTGAALGGLGAYMLGSSGRRRESPTATSYDWERERARMPRASPMANSGYSSQRRPFFDSDDRGEGSSSFGSMRRSTGLGGSNVR
jgi:hypothetical protein